MWKFGLRPRNSFSGNTVFVSKEKIGFVLGEKFMKNELFLKVVGMKNKGVGRLVIWSDRKA